MDDSDLVITLLSSDEDDDVDASAESSSKTYHSRKRKRKPSPVRPEPEELKLASAFASTEEAAAALFGPPPTASLAPQPSQSGTLPPADSTASHDRPLPAKRPRPNRRPPPRPKRPPPKAEGSKAASTNLDDDDDDDSLFDMSKRIEYIAPTPQDDHKPIIRSIFTGHAPSVVVPDSDEEDDPMMPSLLTSMTPAAPAAPRDSPSLRRSVTPPPGPLPTMPSIIPQAPPVLNLSERSSSPFPSSTAATSSTSRLSRRTISLRILAVDNRLEQEHLGSMTMGGEQTFGSVFDELHNRSQFPRDSLLLARGGTILTSVATPDMLGFLAKETLSVFPGKDAFDRYQHAIAEQQRAAAPVPPPSQPAAQTARETPPPADEDNDSGGNKIRLKIRDKGGRELKTVVLSTRTFRVLLDTFCKKFDIPSVTAVKMRLFDPDDEPLDLDEVIGETVEDEDLLTVK